MDGPKWILPAGIGVILTVGAGLWLVLVGPPGDSTATALASRLATDADIRALQAEATNACRCGRRLDDRWNAGCWAAFNRHRDRFRYSETGSACMEESVSLTCFEGPAGADERCVTTQFPYGGCDQAESERLRARAKGAGGCGD